MDGLAAYIEKILPVFTRDPRILALYLLGSAHSGAMRPDSDIDLAILVEPGSRIEALERAEFAAEVAYAIGRDVYLGEMSSLNLVYAREAILKGRRLFERDRGRAELREASMLGMYANFHEERREVADAYRIG